MFTVRTYKTVQFSIAYLECLTGHFCYDVVGMLGNVWEWVSGKAEGGSGKRNKGAQLSAKEKAALADQVRHATCEGWISHI